MSKPEDVSQEAWKIACDLPLYAEVAEDGIPYVPMDERQFIARAIDAAVAAEREAIQSMLAHGAPHSPRRYIYDNTADRRIWACDQLDAAIRARSLP